MKILTNKQETTKLRAYGPNYSWWTICFSKNLTCLTKVVYLHFSLVKVHGNTMQHNATRSRISQRHVFLIVKFCERKIVFSVWRLFPPESENSKWACSRFFFKPQIVPIYHERQFWRSWRKFFSGSLKISCSKSEKKYVIKHFLEKSRSPIFFHGNVECSFDNSSKTFRPNSEKVSLKARKKWIAEKVDKNVGLNTSNAVLTTVLINFWSKCENFYWKFKKIQTYCKGKFWAKCSFGHVEGSFDNPAAKFLLKVRIFLLKYPKKDVVFCSKICYTPNVHHDRLNSAFKTFSKNPSRSDFFGCGPIGSWYYPLRYTLENRSIFSQFDRSLLFMGHLYPQRDSKWSIFTQVQRADSVLWQTKLHLWSET